MSEFPWSNEVLQLPFCPFVNSIYKHLPHACLTNVYMVCEEQMTCLFSFTGLQIENCAGIAELHPKGLSIPEPNFYDEILDPEMIL